MTKKFSMLAFVLIFAAISGMSWAKESTDAPRSMPDISALDADGLREMVKQLCYRIDALEDEVKTLKGQVKKNELANPDGAAIATTSPKSWIVTITGIAAANSTAIENDLRDEQTKLTGAEQKNSSGGRDNSIEGRLAEARRKLQEMQAATQWVTDGYDPPHGHFVNIYSAEDMGRQKVVIMRLETEKKMALQRIHALENQLAQARNTTMLAAKMEDGKPLAITVRQADLSAIARTFRAGQKVQVAGMMTRSTPPMELLAMALALVEGK